MLLNSEVAQSMLEDGERTAPISYMYVRMFEGMLKQAFLMTDSLFFEIQIDIFKAMVEKDESFQKTSKKFQKEFQQVLNFPMEQQYEWCFGRPYPYNDDDDVSTNVNTNVEHEPEKGFKLRLVK